MTRPLPTLADLGDLPLPIDACPNCASLGMRMATQEDGVFAGGGSLMSSRCEHCGFVGQPLVFRDRQAYLDFLRETLAAA
jgi:hypothetical protein